MRFAKTRFANTRFAKTVACAFGLALCAGCAAFAAFAAPKTYDLLDETAAFKPGAGVEAAQNNCTACHSTDYINFQPPNKGQTFWEAEVQKMIKVYHAPIGADDAKTIADYLGQAY